MTDRIRDDGQADSWRADFASAEEHRLDASLCATASERLKWLEEALRFAAKVGALPKTPDDEQDSGVQQSSACKSSPRGSATSSCLGR